MDAEKEKVAPVSGLAALSKAGELHIRLSCGSLWRIPALHGSWTHCQVPAELRGSEAASTLPGCATPRLPITWQVSLWENKGCKWELHLPLCPLTALWLRRDETKAGHPEEAYGVVVPMRTPLGTDGAQPRTAPRGLQSRLQGKGERVSGCELPLCPALLYRHRKPICIPAGPGSHLKEKLTCVGGRLALQG